MTTDILGSLAVAVAAHAGVIGEPVTRPLIGLALTIPTWATPADVAAAIDAEGVTAGFVDFQGRACVAAPADVGVVTQAAHAVAKVMHGLLELHTPYINAQSEACAVPRSGPDLDAEALAEAVLERTGALLDVLYRWQLTPASPGLHATVAEGLALIRAFLAEEGDIS